MGDGICPTDPTGQGEQLSSSAPTGTESGLQCRTSGDLNQRGSNHVTEEMGFSWYKIKGSSYEYGGRFKAVFTMGLYHSITVGFKTKIEIGKFKTWDLGHYFSEMFAAKYEIITGGKNETVGGDKLDTQRKGSGKKYEFTGALWKSVAKAKQREKEKRLEELVKTLSERAGARLEQTIDKMTQEVKAYKERINTVNLRIVKELRVKAEKVQSKITEMERHVSNMEWMAKEFERKSNTMDEAVDSAMEIKCSENGNHGNLIKMSASTHKFMCNLVKLGE